MLSHKWPLTPRLRNYQRSQGGETVSTSGREDLVSLSFGRHRAAALMTPGSCGGLHIVKPVNSQQSSTEQETVSLTEESRTVAREPVFFKHVAPSRSATIIGLLYRKHKLSLDSEIKKEGSRVEM